MYTLISGADAMLAGPDSAESGMIAETLVSVPAISIAGGTDEIQKTSSQNGCLACRKISAPIRAFFVTSSATLE